MVDENLYLFTGTSEIFIQNRISRIISSYDKQQVSIIKYDMEQTSFSRVLEDACTLPFLEDLKIIILRNPTFLTTKGDLANDAKNFIKYLKNPVETSIIIINAITKRIFAINNISILSHSIFYKNANYSNIFFI